MAGSYEMSFEQRLALQKTKVFFINNLVVNEDLLSHCLVNGILTDELLEDIRAKDSKKEKVTSLVELLPKRGPETFDKFIDVLVRTDQSHIADKLKETEGDEKLAEIIGNARDSYFDRNIDPRRQFKALIEDRENYLRYKYRQMMKEEDDSVDELHEEIRTLKKELRQTTQRQKCYKMAFYTTAKSIQLVEGQLGELVELSQRAGSLESELRKMMESNISELDRLYCEDVLIDDMKACESDFKRISNYLDTLAYVHIAEDAHQGFEESSDDDDRCDGGSLASQGSVREKLDKVVLDVKSVLAKNTLNLVHHSKLKNAVSTIAAVSDTLPVLLNERNTTHRLEICLMDLRNILGKIKGEYDENNLKEDQLETKQEEMALMKGKRGMERKVARAKKCIEELKAQRVTIQERLVRRIKEAIQRCNDGVRGRYDREPSDLSEASGAGNNQHTSTHGHVKKNLLHLVLEQSLRSHDASNGSKEEPPVCTSTQAKTVDPDPPQALPTTQTVKKAVNNSTYKPVTAKAKQTVATRRRPDKNRQHQTLSPDKAPSPSKTSGEQHISPGRDGDVKPLPTQQSDSRHGGASSKNKTPHRPQTYTLQKQETPRPAGPKRQNNPAPDAQPHTRKGGKISLVEFGVMGQQLRPREDI